MKKPKGGAAWLMLLLCGILLPAYLLIYVVPHGLFTEKEYLEHGVRTKCTVQSVMTAYFIPHVTVTYTNEDGKTLTARAYPNQRVREGDTFEGYYLPDTARTVLQPAPLVRKIGSLALLAVLFLTGWIFWISHLRAMRTFRLLERKGIRADGVLQSIRKQGYARFGTFEFMTESGKLLSRELLIPRGNGTVNEKYDVRYYEKSNGKCIVVLTDFRLV